MKKLLWCLAALAITGPAEASTYSSSVKFYIMNPFPSGFLILRLSPLKQLQAVEYLPAKRSDVYPSASLDMYFEQTSTIGIVGTALGEDASDALINRERAQAPKLLAEGKVSLWKITHIRPGATKVHITLKQQGGGYGFMPNGPVQESYGPEVTLSPIYSALSRP
jgi:hypothetical protein